MKPIHHTRQIPSRLLENFKALSEKVDVGIIVIADRYGFPIIFTSKIAPFLGYNDKELLKKTLVRLLPITVRGRHKQLMDQFKEEIENGVSRPMSSGRTVTGLHKLKIEVELSISISYYKSVEDGVGVFIALIQDPHNIELENKALEKLKLSFGDIVYRGKQLQRRAWKAIALRIAKGGGIVTITAGLLTQLTPLGTALRGFMSTWNWATQTQNVKDVRDIGIYKKISSRDRDNNLVLVRNQIQKSNKKVIAVAYIRVDNEDGNVTLKYQSDSSSQVWGEIWFFDDDEGDENQVRLNEEQLKKLRAFECISIKDGAKLLKVINQPLVQVIYCPTVNLETFPFNENLTRFQFRNIVALALAPDVTIQEGTPEFISLTGKLFEFHPSLENFNP